MGYGREVYDAAIDVVNKRKMDAETKAAAVRENIYAKNPRAGEIERLMSQSAIKIARAVLDGKNADKAVEEIKHENLSLQAELAEILRSNGFSYRNFEPKYFCEKCSDTGYTQRSVCSCLEQAMREEAYSRISFAGNMSNAAFESFSLKFYPTERDEATGISLREHMEDVYNYCKSYSEDFSKGSPSLLFHGPTGVGKTHLSLSIAKEAIMKGFGAVYGPVQMLLHKIEGEHFGRSEKIKGSTEDMLIESDLLVLDDLGTEFTSNFYNSSLYNIINSRILTSKPTIVSTNLSQRELFDRYGEQISSRINGTYIPIRFNGKDIRQIKLRNQIS